jgi:rhamnose transport system ATP-binding protein
VAVIYISHRLDEIFRIADRVTVIRDGQHISTRPIAEVTEDGMVRDMVGRAMESFAVKAAANPHGAAAVSAAGWGGRACSAASTSTCTRARCCAWPAWSARGAPTWRWRCSASPPRPRARSRWRAGPSPSAARAPRWTWASPMCPKTAASWACAAACRSLPTSRWRPAQVAGAFGLIDRRAEPRWPKAYRQQAGDPSPDVGIEVGKLSGGNQQKVMLAKWLETKPRVLIFDEPTRGIDVGAKAEVHGIIRRLAAEGVAVLVISSDLPEVLALADRVLVMREGRQAGILPIAEATQERVIGLAAGQERDAA